MAHFTKGKTYTNADQGTYPYGSGTYGSVVTNVQNPAVPTSNYLCTGATKEFAVFKGKSGSPLGTTRRLKVYQDSLGDFVYPRGRFSGAPILRA
jgi:hypothetical protein